MKTAIIKTGFWQDDDVFELNSDTRLLYLCLLTNPQRDLLPAFRVSDRMLSAYTGYSRDLIDLCRKQLIASGRIFYEEGFYIFTTQDFVKPSAGRDSSKIYDREYAKLPLNVRKIVEDIHSKSTGTSTGTPSGTSTGYINIDINKDIDIDNNKDIDKSIVKLDPNAGRLATVLHTSVQQNYPFVKQKDSDIENWASDVEKIHRIDGYEWNIIEMVLQWSQQDEFWKQNIRSGSKFRKQFERLLISAKAEHDKQEKHGVTIV